MICTKYVSSASFACPTESFSRASPHPEATGLKIPHCPSASGEEKQKEVMDSIQYAKPIQTSQLPGEKYVVKTLNTLRK